MPALQVTGPSQTIAVTASARVTLCGRWQQGLAPLSCRHLPFLSLPVLSVGARQPESFIGYFTTACVTIVLAIVSYVVLPHMVRLLSW